MAGDVEAERFLFVLELQPFRPRLGRIQTVLFLASADHHAKQAALPDFLFALLALSPIHGAIDVGIKQRTIRIDTVECARLDQAFHDAFVDGPQIDALAEIEKRLERLVRRRWK